MANEWEDVEYHDAREIIPSIFPGARVTSTSRSRSDPLSRKNPRSPHIDNPNAFDVAPIPGMTFEDFVGEMKNKGYEIEGGLDEVNHPSPWATGAHWHGVISSGPKNGGWETVADAPQQAAQPRQPVPSVDPLAGAMAQANPNDPLAQRLNQEQRGDSPPTEAPYTGWGLDPKGETMRSLGYADFMEPGLDPAQRVSRFLKSVPASAISTGAAGFQAAQAVVDALSRGADKLWDGTALDEAVANLYGVHMRPSELIGGSAEAFPLGGIEFGGFKPHAPKGIVESLDDNGNVIATTADDGPGLTGSVTQTEEFPSGLEPPKNPLDFSRDAEPANDRNSGFPFNPHKVIGVPDWAREAPEFKGMSDEQIILELDKERARIEDEGWASTGEPGFVVPDNDNPMGSKSAQVPESLDPVVRDGILDEPANDPLPNKITPEQEALLQQIPDDPLFLEDTNKPPASANDNQQPFDLTGADTSELRQHPDGIPLALSKEPMNDFNGGEPPKPPVDIVARITEDLKVAGKARAEQNELYKAERAKRFGAVSEAQQPGKGQQAYFDSLAALKGELPKADFEGVRHKYTQTDVDDLFDIVTSTPTLTNLGKVSAQAGLTKILEGRVPAPKELAHLAESFPPEFIKTVLEKRDVFSKSLGKLGETWNLPKSLMSSADLSAPLRQGIGLSYRGEYWKAFGEMFKYAVKQKNFDALDESIKLHPNYALAEESGLALTTTAGKLGKHEDAFRSHVAEKLPVIGPIVRGSERAYVGFLNKLRFDTFNSLVKDAQSLGHDLKDPAVTKSISNYINVMTGRGGLGKLEPAAGALNAALFSPRLISSRLQMLTAPVQAGVSKAVKATTGKELPGGVIGDLPAGMKREAAKSYAAMIGAYSTAIGLASMAGYEVVGDPRSSDFGKVRDGNTRVDLGSGLIQYITAGTRALTRESTSLKSGETRELKKRGDTPLDTDLKFLFNKLHPTLSLFVDQQRGTDAVGNPSNQSVDIPLTQQEVPWSKAILSRLTPMGIPDIVASVKEHPDHKGTLYAVLGLLGAGLQNFDENAPRTKTSAPAAPVSVQEMNTTPASEGQWETIQ